MCLIVFAWQQHPRCKLVLVANRDEQHARPAAPMGWWPDQPNVLAGRDLQAGGTWLGISRSGRFAVVTNYREYFRAPPAKLSRGKLVRDFVVGDKTPLAFSQGLNGDDFAGFSLLTADNESLCYTTNREDPPQLLAAGVYGLSNATLDTPWPKLTRSRDGLHKLLERDEINPNSLMNLLADTTPAAVKDIDDELPVDLARAVSAPFIKTETYGTRCTSVVLVENDGSVLVAERRFDASGNRSGENQYLFNTGEP
ncbi:MAG: NRDE family protein [Woeseia sp.]|nr:NRDE family protein [Woeseia sp.]MBT8095797.1 NRDE family protein [Woeseia sp.]NNE61753.1 NRDE family protein [Woeseia sp.]NNL54166.1 NRDE family protein [Woeseia sp.]